MLTLFDVVVTAVLTYGLHSAVACGIAIAISRRLKRPEDRDLVWKAALVAPVCSAAATIGVSIFGDRGAFVDLANLIRHTLPFRLPGRQIMVRVVDDGSGPDVVRRLTDPVTSVLSGVVIACTLCVVGIAVARLIHRRRELSRGLATRRRIRELRLDAGRRNTITLSVAERLQSPVAISSAEVCLPTEVMDAFSEEHRRSLIAHEVAHIERRDPAWFLLAEIVAALSAFQPLVFVITRAFRRDVELICDEAAVRRTNDRAALIGALARLAAPFDPRAPMFGAATAYDGSPLVARATRIATLPLTSGSMALRGSRRIALAVVVVLSALLALVPVVSAAPRASDFSASPDDVMRRARAEGHLVSVDSTVIVGGMDLGTRRRTIVRLQ